MGTYRQLLSTEMTRYQEHLLRLDSDSRYARFSAVTSDPVIRRYCEDIDWRTTKIIGFFKDGVLRGAAEIRYDQRPLPDQAELAFSVEKECQSSRIGTSLMVRALLHLRNRAVTKAHIVCLLSNRRMQKLALRYRADFKAYRGDVFLTIDVPYGDISSLTAELVDGYLGWMNAGIDIVLGSSGSILPLERLLHPELSVAAPPPPPVPPRS
ncbi:MAG: GNAT family N-acetyltransferase [Rhodospirillaceae bacterium]